MFQSISVPIFNSSIFFQTRSLKAMTMLTRCPRSSRGQFSPARLPILSCKETTTTAASDEESGTNVAGRPAHSRSCRPTAASYRLYPHRPLKTVNSELSKSPNSKQDSFLSKLLKKNSTFKGYQKCIQWVSIFVKSTYSDEVPTCLCCYC